MEEERGRRLEASSRWRRSSQCSRALHVGAPACYLLSCAICGCKLALHVQHPHLHLHLHLRPRAPRVRSTRLRGHVLFYNPHFATGSCWGSGCVLTVAGAFGLWIGHGPPA